MSKILMDFYCNHQIMILFKKNFQVVPTRKPNKKIFDNLIFAFNVCRFVKSNAIVITRIFLQWYWFWTVK